jgi:hypothetical protein
MGQDVLRCHARDERPRTGDRESFRRVFNVNRSRSVIRAMDEAVHHQLANRALGIVREL